MIFSLERDIMRFLLFTWVERNIIVLIRPPIAHASGVFFILFGYFRLCR